MTKIKTARTPEGDKFYYLGHTQAVVDDNGNNIEDLLAEQEEKIELLNDNTGVSEYPEFSTSKTYKTGTIVRHEGALFKFTSDHEPGIWDLEEVKSWSINAESQEKLSDLGSKVREKIGDYASVSESLINKTGQWLVTIGEQRNVKFVINASSVSGTVQAQIHNYDVGVIVSKYIEAGENVLEYEGDGSSLNLVINITGELTADIQYSYGVKSNIQDINEELDNIDTKVNELKNKMKTLEEDVDNNIKTISSKIGNYGYGTALLENESGQWLLKIGKQKTVGFIIDVKELGGHTIAQINEIGFGNAASKVLEKGLNVLEYQGEEKNLQLVINISANITADVSYFYGEKSKIEDINKELSEINKREETLKNKIDVLENKVEAVEPLTAVINAKPIVEYGNEAIESNETFIENTILAYTESIVASKSVLKSIKFEPISNGEYKFGIGVIDWRTWGIIRETFVVNVTDTTVTIYDVSDYNIVINEGETLFLYVEGGRGVKIDNKSRTISISKKDDDNIFKKIEKTILIDATTITAGPNQGIHEMQLEKGRYRFVFSNISTTGTYNYGVQQFPSGDMVFRSYKISGDSFELSVDTTTTVRGILNIASGVTASMKMDVYKLEAHSATLQWQSVSYTSIFAEKGDINELKSSIDTVKEKAEVAYNNIGIIYDDLGYPHQLSLSNGQVVATAMGLYKNIAIIGNSLLTGFDEPSTGLYGMAASVYSNDFCGFIMKELRNRDSSAKYTRCQGSFFEQNLFTDDASFANMTSNIPNNVDLIVIRLGENVRNVSSIQPAFIALIKYLKKTFTQATVVMTSTILNYSSAYNEPLKAAALSEDIKYIDIDGSNYETEMIGISRMYYQQGVFKPSYFAIQTHSNDLGFLKIANAILAAINYKKLDVAHNINTSSSVTFDAPKQGVENGWVTIKTYGNVKPNISVVDIKGTPIEVQHFDLSTFTYDKRFRDGVTEDTATYASVFKMPNSDVSVTIK